MRQHRQLAQEERYQIYALNKAGHNQTEIAEQLGRHKSTISRVLRRNRGLRGYRPAQAQKLADNRKQEKVRPRITDEVWQWVNLLMAEEGSPEQISGWLLSEALGSISPEWISMYIRTNVMVVISTVTYAARRHGKSAMATMIAVAR